MMGIVMPETCWAYKKYNKIASSWFFIFYLLKAYLSTLKMKGLRDIANIHQAARCHISKSAVLQFIAMRTSSMM